MVNLLSFDKEYHNYLLHKLTNFFYNIFSISITNSYIKNFILIS